MKRKTIALLLALMMCLSLLSACGADSKPDGEPSAAGNTSAPTEQPDENEEKPTQQPEETEKLMQKPEESVEPTQEPEEHEGTKLIALLQEEWQNGFYEGEGPRHTYFDCGNKINAICNGVVFIDNRGLGGNYVSYNIATTELKEVEPPSNSAYNRYLIDNCFYERGDSKTIVKRDCNGAELKSFELGEGSSGLIYPFEKGIFVPMDKRPSLLLSYDLEKIAEIPAPQRELEHGLKEDIKVWNYSIFRADGTIYLYRGNEGIYRLNTDNYEWETVELPEMDGYAGRNPTVPFCGKYVTRDHDTGIYDWLTWEKVFDWEEAGVYPPVSATQYRDDYLSYFGGDKYLGFGGDKEYRWVYLKDLTMSEPLQFPAKLGSGDLMVLNDTYCVYVDEYGWFLLNYNTGEEETIMMFDN